MLKRGALRRNTIVASTATRFHSRPQP